VRFVETPVRALQTITIIHHFTGFFNAKSKKSNFSYFSNQILRNKRKMSGILFE